MPPVLDTSGTPSLTTHRDNTLSSIRMRLKSWTASPTNRAGSAGLAHGGRHKPPEEWIWSDQPDHQRAVGIPPDHPALVYVNEAILLDALTGFLATAVYGPAARRRITTRIGELEADLAERQAALARLRDDQPPRSRPRRRGRPPGGTPVARRGVARPAAGGTPDAAGQPGPDDHLPPPPACRGRRTHADRQRRSGGRCTGLFGGRDRIRISVGVSRRFYRPPPRLPASPSPSPIGPDNRS